jgi:PEP-CTERM motif
MTVNGYRIINIFILVLSAMTGVLLPTECAQATLLGTSITANLNSPLDSVDLTDVVTVGSGIEIQAGDGSNIGTVMFTSTNSSNVDVPEYIDFFDTGVTLRIAGASSSGDGTTGYSMGGEYIFTLPSIISGITSIDLSSNISNFSNTAQPAGCTAGICLDSTNDTLSVFLDKMVIGPDAAGDLPAPMGLITINLASQVTPPPPPPPPVNVPEPSTLLLLAAGWLGFASARRWQHV